MYACCDRAVEGGEGSVPRGGRRAGIAGRQYSQRTDLATAANQKPLPAQAATGQQWGKATEQLQAQQAVPMAPPPTATPVAAEPQGPLPPLPGELTPLTAPSQRPHEPVTSGLPIGAGPGPEILGPVGSSTSVADVLANLARVTNNPDVADLARRAQVQGS